MPNIGFLFLLALFLRAYVAQPFNIPSASNQPTLVVGDYILVSKLSYNATHHPQAGDMAVFKYPADTSVDFIKRVIGLPGDRVQMVQGQVKLNGRLLPQTPVRMDPAFYRNENQTVGFMRENLPNGVSYIVSNFGMTDQDNTSEFVVPPGHYFMLGDSRDNSVDSRFLDRVGYVPEANFVGPVICKFMSKSKLPWRREPVQ